MQEFFVRHSTVAERNVAPRGNSEMNWQDLIKPLSQSIEPQKHSFTPTPKCLRAAAQDAVFAARGRDIRDRVGDVEFNKMVEDELTIIIKRYDAVAQNG